MVAQLLGEVDGSAGYDLVKLVSWFNVDVATGVVGQVDYDAKLPYPDCKQRELARASYGWSFVYRRALVACVPFVDTCWGEDSCLTGTVLQMGLRLRQVIIIIII